MILTCPQCDSRYLLSAQVLAPDGRRVKCAGCGEIWRQMPDPEEMEELRESGEYIQESQVSAEDEPEESRAPQFEDIPEFVKPVPEPSAGSTLYGSKANKPPGVYSGYTAAACIFMITGIIWLGVRGSVVETWPPAALIYETLGLKVSLSAEKLAFDGVEANAKEDAEGELIAVAGRIINQTHADKKAPLVEAVLRSETGDILARWMIELPQENIASGEAVAFNSEYHAPDKNGRDVHLRFVLQPPKIDAAGGDNNPAQGEGGQTHPSVSEEGAESPAPASSGTHPESSH